MSRPNPRRANGWRRDQLRKRVLAAYDVCAICGKPVDKSLRTPHLLSAEVDELVPVSRGGDPLDFSNCRLVHRRCNRLKSNKSDTYARALLAGKQMIRSTSLPLMTSGDW
ncbi:HNH endonuclease signature motif containing protein [Bifidobacterium simiiventris]|uniref:HNH endonuclease signature motif containing protein n=1 Tax=Bifidobacterium simiiventris TaxID=2834434 RepID=UPI001C569B6F|nr:HNH endonuclease signature motif containing protein [Bifidobacterium simiiventris]MBW3078223.1 HNH endonuclease [Bifidobacterium simiiventris]